MILSQGRDVVTDTQCDDCSDHTVCGEVRHDSHTCILAALCQPLSSFVIRKGVFGMPCYGCPCIAVDLYTYWHCMSSSSYSCKLHFCIHSNDWYLQ